MTKALFNKGFKANLHPFVWGVVLLFCFIGIKVEGQITYDWLNTAPDGYWRQGASAARWNPGGLFDEPPNASGAILRFNNNHQLTMNNNVLGTYSLHQIVFGSSNTLSRTISGNTVQLFEFGATWPFFVNQSSTTHTISLPIIASNTGGINLELIANAGPLIFSGTINNNGRNLMIYGNNSVLDGTNRFIRLSGVVSGAGGLTISQLGVARLNAAHTFSGTTQIDNGELWIESAGTINNSSATNVGNAGQTGNTAKIWLSNASGSTTFSNNLTINQGNAGTREIGGLNTSGTHIFSGTITNNSTNGLNLRTLNAGGTTDFTGVISGTNPINISGAGVVRLTGNNTYTGATTIQTGTTLQVGIGGANTPLGTNAAGTTINSGGVLDLNGFSIATTEALTLNGTGISSGGALLNSSATFATIPGAITLGSASSINTTGDITTNGIISGANALTKIGNGTLILSAANTYSAGTTINAGTVQLNNTSGLGTAGVTMGGGTLSLNGNTISIPSLSGTSGTVQNANASAATLTVNTSSNTSYSGNIADGTGAGALTFIKSGTGTLTLSGTNSFTGNTTVTAGTLVYDNINALRTSSNLTVNASTINIGANFSGSKTAGDLTVTGASAITFASSANSVNLMFANFTASAATTITISGWSPTNAKKIFVTNQSSLSSDLGKINFIGYGIGAKFIVATGELVPAQFYITVNTVSSGNFNVGTNWINGGPLGTGGEYIYVQPNFTLIMDNAYTVSGATVAGTLNLGANNLNIQTGGTLVNVSGATYTGTGAINFQGTATISGTGTVSNVIVNSGAVDFGTGTTIGAGYSLTFSNTAGSVNTNAPRYASGSTLIYNSTGTFNRGLEWSAGNGSTIGVTVGYPSNVTVTGGTTVNMTANGVADRAMQGNLTLGNTTGTGSLTLASMSVSDIYVGGNLTIGGSSGTSTLTLSSTIGGDLYLGGNWLRNSTGSFVDNDRAVFFNGASGNQTITGPSGVETFSYLIINKALDNVQLNATDVTVDGGGSVAGFILELWNGNLDVNGRTFRFLIESGGVANNLGLDGSGTRQVISSSGTGAFDFEYGTGSAQTVAISQRAGSGLLSFASTITVSIRAANTPLRAGVNFGANLTTIAGTLRIDQGGFVTGNAPIYSTGSTLIYNSGNNYDRTTEWTTTTGAGYPHHVIVQNGTDLRIYSGSNGGPTLATGGDVTVVSGSTIITAAQANNITIGGALNINGTFNAAGMNSGADLFVTGNLTIAGIFTLATTSGSDFYLSGNWNRTGTFNANTRAVYLRGGNSTITATGGETFPFLRIEKTASSNTITLASPVTIITEVSFTTGIVVSSFNNNLLIMNAGSSYTGGSSSSFVSGPMKKIGNTAFNFPVGKRVNSTNHYRYIGLAAGGAVDDDYIAEFHRQSSTVRGWISPAAALAGLQRVSFCEHWFLRRMVGSAIRPVTLTWTVQSNCNAGNYVTDLSDLVVVQYEGSGWGDTFGQSANNGIIAPTGVQTGTITWNTPSNYLFFTLGSIDLSTNPLPFTLLSFNGRNRSSDIELAFSVKGNNEQQQYIIERSADGRSFTTLNTITAKQNLSEADYTTLDEQPLNGWNFYRLTAVDVTGSKKQSQIIRIWFGNRIGKPAIYPNPVQGNQVQLFTGGLAKGIYNVQVVGMDGKIILSRSWQFDGTQPLYSIPVTQLPAGMYYLVLSGENQPPVQLKFVK